MIANLTPKSILKNQPSKEAADYDFLRKKGMEYITELSGRLWTDHNSHDPGITIMEMICYALTDLSYRTNFPMKDLIALSDEEKQMWNDKYPTPHPKASYNQVLPTHPVTVNDYRKLLLKIEGIRNAWLQPNCGSAEVPFFLDCENSELVFTSFEYTFKTGVYKDASVLLTFPEVEKYRKWQSELKVVGVTSVQTNGRKTIVNLELAVGTKKVNHSISLLFKTNKAPSKAYILSLFNTHETETLWEDFWKQQQKIINKEFKKIELNGLYNVLLELEVDPEMGPLTERKLHYKIPFGNLKGVPIIFELKNAILPKFPEFNTIVSVGPIIQLADDKDIWLVDLELEINGSSFLISNAELRMLGDIPIAFTTASLSQKKAMIIEALGNETTNPDNSIISTYWKKQNRINDILKTVCCVLDAHRNLCEDYLNVDLVAAQHLGICMDIETNNAADLEVLMAKVTLAIETYLNPPLKNYSLQELLDDGQKAGEIFDGPYVDYSFECSHKPDVPVFTKPGFIKTAELEASALKSVLYTSDIINILMDFDEIIAVKNVLLRKFDSYGEAEGKSEKWCLNIPEGKQAVFNSSLSKVTFFKDEIPYSAKKTETEQTLKFLRAKSKKNAYIPIDQHFKIEKGTFRELDCFYPLQHDLPDIYGTTPMRLPKNVITILKT